MIMIFVFSSDRYKRIGFAFGFKCHFLDCKRDKDPQKAILFITLLRLRFMSHNLTALQLQSTIRACLVFKLIKQQLKQILKQLGKLLPGDGCFVKAKIDRKWRAKKVRENLKSDCDETAVEIVEWLVYEKQHVAILVYGLKRIILSEKVKLMQAPENNHFIQFNVQQQVKTTCFYPNSSISNFT